MLESLKRFVRDLRHKLKRGEVEERDGFRLYRYRRDDGSFDYERYRQVQTEGNRRKLDKVWAVEDNVAFLAEYIRSRMTPRFGLCHGTRRGKEQEWFRKHLGCEVIGTEISDTATQFPHTIQWDFHEVKPEWIDSVDFIYSNSLDHSYDPNKALDAWMRCVRPDGGVCLLEHTSRHEHATELDPFGAAIDEMPDLIAEWGAGRYRVAEILEAPSVAPSLRYCRYLVVVRS